MRVPPVAGSSGGCRQAAVTAEAAASRLGIGQADELVADDVVRETERALEFVECATRCQELEDDVVARTASC